MVDWLQFAFEIIPYLVSGYAVYVALRSKAHSEWNAEDIGLTYEFNMRKFPEEFHAFLQGQEFEPEEWPLEGEANEPQEVPA